MRRIVPLRIAFVAALALGRSFGFAQSTYQDAADFSKYAEKLRESAIRHMEPQVAVPNPPRTFSVSSKYPWKTGIVTTVFWIGGAGKTGDAASAWDPKWEKDFGGFDNPNPDVRHNFIPVSFVPQLNPFYVALPYNDVARGVTKPEAKIVIPWFADLTANGQFTEGQSICRDRWLAIRNSAGKVCYAQWSDCGPFRADHWQYVFGNEKPKPNANGGAGLNVSPAVRDFLQMGSTDVTDWKFVEVTDVPNGPWALYGKNNSLVQNALRSPAHVAVPVTPVAPKTVSPPAPVEPSAIVPNIISKQPIQE